MALGRRGGIARVRNAEPQWVIRAEAHLDQHVERQNLAMRMHMRRFTRLTNAFSKKFQNHMHMVALYTVYNWTKIHKTTE